MVFVLCVSASDGDEEKERKKEKLRAKYSFSKTLVEAIDNDLPLKQLPGDLVEKRKS